MISFFRGSEYGHSVTLDTGSLALALAVGGGDPELVVNPRLKVRDLVVGEIRRQSDRLSLSLGTRCRTEPAKLKRRNGRIIALFLNDYTNISSSFCF